MLRSLFICTALCVYSLCPAQEENAESAAAVESPAETAATLRDRMAAFAELLSQVQDAESAAAMAAPVQEAFTTLLQTDGEEADEEEVAAELEEAFAPVDAELARLEEADFFDSAELRAVFAEPTEAEVGVIFPVGAFDFLRGGAGSGEQHVCPREEGGLPLLNWNEGE